MFKRNITFYERKKERNYYKKWILHEKFILRRKESLYYEFLRKTSFRRSSY